jgi:hypothetical protein
MKPYHLAIPLGLAAMLLLLAAGAAVLAQTSARFDLEWHVVAGSGGESSSASYQVNGTIGQSLTGPPTSSGASFAVSSGYWFPEAGRSLYLPAVFKE